MSPIPDHHYLDLGPTSLMVYNPFKWVCSRSKGVQYIRWVQRWATCEIQGGCVSVQRCPCGSHVEAHTLIHQYYIYKLLDQ